jgi:hypothetical protein
MDSNDPPCLFLSFLSAGSTSMYHRTWSILVSLSYFGIHLLRGFIISKKSVFLLYIFSNINLED